MDYKQIESKWQKIWADTGLYKFDRSRVDKKYYCLEMFSYPRGRNFTRDTGTTTDLPTRSRALSVCKATRFFSRWDSTRSDCLPKTTP